MSDIKELLEKIKSDRSVLEELKEELRDHLESYELISIEFTPCMHTYILYFFGPSGILDNFPADFWDYASADYCDLSYSHMRVILDNVIDRKDPEHRFLGILEEVPESILDCEIENLRDYKECF